MGSLEASVRNQVSLFVAGVLSADRFNDVLPGTAELDEANDPEAMAVVMRAIGYLAEYQSGDRDEDDVRLALASDASWSLNEPKFSGVTPPAPGDSEVQVLAVVGTPLRAVFA